MNAMTPEEAVKQTLVEYYATFSTLDLNSILPYFHEPATFLGSAGVYPIPDSNTLSAALGQTLEGLKAKDYGRSEFDFKQLTVLSATDALARGVALRFKKDGSVLERVGITYTMHKTPDRWKIAVMVLHDVID